MKFLRYLFIPAIIFALNTQAVFAQEIPFAGEMAEFKAIDKTNPPKARSTLFIGSSSIRKWTGLETRFPGKDIIRRGLGGSQIWQWVKYYLPDMVLSYKPAKVFIYVGENDLAAGKTGTDVFRDFETIYTILQKELPATKVYFMAIKPSPSREKYQPEIDKANALIRNFLKRKVNGTYVDTAKPIYNAGGKGDPALFEADGIHLNDKGYARWEQVLKNYL